MNVTEKILNTADPGLGASQVVELRKFGEKVNRLGVNFAVCDSNGEMICLAECGEFTSSPEQLTAAANEALARIERAETDKNPQVYRTGEFEQIIVYPLKWDTNFFAAIMDAGKKYAEKDRDIAMKLLSEMLTWFTEHFRLLRKAEQEVDAISGELAQTYEELILLHKLSTNMKVTESDSNFLQMACDNLTDIVGVEGIAILLERIVDDEKKLVIAAGSGVINVDDEMSAHLHDRLVVELKNGKEALLDSEVDRPFKYNWPENIRNIIAVPLFGKDKAAVESGAAYGNIIGLMAAANRLDKPDFDSIDVKLFNSVANGCAVFVENGRLFSDLKELFIGSLKALTSSIDAKDQYTRGHSERVAFISRWIAREIAEEEGLDQEQINKIYLAGLLHDIGKVGIDEAVLRKKESLTPEEFEHIKKHPSIGAGILSGIKQMRDIVPGVLYHHERVDGKGYPGNVSGEKMPLISKIIAVADSFDAMTSRRTYRDAMTVEHALEELEKGFGTQFDTRVGNAFIKSDVHRLWNIIQNGFTDIYSSHDFSAYGTYAVGTLIK